MIKAKDINLGARVRCKFTGFSGHVMKVDRDITGCDLYGIQPGVITDGQLSELTFISSKRFEIVEPTNSDLEFNPKLEYGQAVRDVITGFEGLITSISYSVDGYIHYAVQAKGVDKDGKLMPAYSFDEGRLEVLNVPKVNVDKPYDGCISVNNY